MLAPLVAVRRGSGPIWLLNAALLVAALILYVGVVEEIPPPITPVRVPWWMLTAGFLLAEVGVVHYHFRREAHSFSMSELPLVFGLFFATPRELVAAQIAGAAVALLAHRRQTGMKLVFNLGHFALGTCLAIVVFHGLTDEALLFEPTTWTAALLAALMSSALSTGAIFVAISLSERRAELRKLTEQHGLGLLATVGSASLGLVGVGAAWHHPWGAWLLIVPVGTFTLAYRGYVTQRQQHDSLEFLYNSAQILERAPDLASGAGDLLLNACRTFRAELAQFALLSERDGQLALLVEATTDGFHTVGRAKVEQLDGLLLRALQSEQSQMLTLRPPAPGPDGRALRHAMTSPLRSDSRTRGAVMLGNRLGAAGAFGTEDLKLFQTLVTQISVSLENGRLAQMLGQATERARRERDNSLLLQRGLLPSDLPSVPHASVAARYVPGAAGEEVGGDWYDLLELPGGRVGAAIGDVLGHDLQAATHMGQARTALRAYAAEGHPPAALMDRLNRLLAETEPDFMGTCCYLELDADRGAVTLVLAGHPPPLLIDPHGRARLVDATPNLPLGVDATTPYTHATVCMPVGSTLVLYTDGLVESRTVSLSEGLDRLIRVPQDGPPADVETLADRLLDHLPSAQASDDVALLVLRHQPA